MTSFKQRKPSACTGGLFLMGNELKMKGCFFNVYDLLDLAGVICLVLIVYPLFVLLCVVLVVSFFLDVG